MVMFRHKRFCSEIARPVDYGAAQRFRWLTILHVYLPMLVGTVFLYAFAWPTPFEDRFFDHVFQAVWPMAILHCGMLLFLAAATGIPSYFFHPRDIPIEQQNRAIALSYYACAALAWTPLAFVLLPAGVFLADVHETAGLLLVLLAVVLPFGQLAAWAADLFHIGVRIMPQRKGRLAVLAIALPLIWLALWVLVCFLGIVLFLLILLASSLV
ncbi:MAG: hypothetical protein ACYSVY_12505 [Planctomycetota bacterium]|jgi:hypothetical protein